MKRAIRFTVIVFLPLAFAGSMAASGPPVEMVPAPDGGWFAQWTPQGDNAAYLQVSEDLERWIYLPAIVAGTTAPQRWWVDSDGARLFFRLKLVPMPPVPPGSPPGTPPNPWDHDSDGDGLSDAFELANGWDPFDPAPPVSGAAAEDEDADGLGLPREDQLKKSPLHADHPDVKLKVSITPF